MKALAHLSRRALAAVILVATFAAACTPAPATAPAAQKGAPAGPTGTLTISQLALLPRADPYAVTANAEHSIVYSIWDPLSRVDEEGNTKMYLAESWQQESPTSWIVKLRKDARWHDGVPFTSADVLFSIDYIRDADGCKCIWTSAYSYVLGGEAIDANTVRINTKDQQVGMPVDFGRVAMMPKHAVEKMGKDAYFQAPVGTGPFKLAKITPGESWTLEANENYYLGAPKVKTLIWKRVPDPATRVAELLSGASDIIIGVPPNELPRIDGSSNARSVVGPSVIRVLMDFAISTTPELKDKRVREAVALAIDADAINKAVYDGKGGKQTGHFDRHSFGYNKDLQPHPYDPVRAKQLLAEAGFPNGMPIVLQRPKDSYLLDNEVSLAVVDYLTKGGFKVDYQPIDFAQFSAMRLKTEYKGLQLGSSRNSTGDPDQIMRGYDPKRQDKYLLDKQLEALIDAQASEPDRAKRAVKVAALDQYLHENFLALNLMTVPSLDGVNKRVEGFVQSPFETYSFLGVSVK